MNKWITTNGYAVYKVLGGRSNVFLIQHNNKHLLIDTSIKGNEKELIKTLSKLDVTKESLIALILTHSHFDHVGNAYSIKNLFDTKIYIHSSEKINLQNAIVKIPKGIATIPRFISYLGSKVAEKFKFAEAQPDVCVEDSFDFKDIGLNITILHTPGHSIGSMSIIVDGEIAIVGDLMFGVFYNGLIPPFADFPSEMINSWGKLLETECKIFLPSHGSERSRELVQKKFKKYKWHKKYKSLKNK